jgi:hypothetical protein
MMVVSPLPDPVIVVDAFNPTADTLPLWAAAEQVLDDVTDTLEEPLPDVLETTLDEELIELLPGTLATWSASHGKRSVLRRSWTPFGPFTQVR